eukprot:3690646-Prymnesium_polylepis.1
MAARTATMAQSVHEGRRRGAGACRGAQLIFPMATWRPSAHSFSTSRYTVGRTHMVGSLAVVL